MKKKNRQAVFDAPAPHNENRDSCDMVPVCPTTNFYAKETPNGALCYRQIEAPCGEMYRVLWHKLPNGNVGCIPIEPVPMSARPIWVHGKPPRCHIWNLIGEDKEKPTLAPSVHARGSWHGWFRAGRMESV